MELLESLQAHQSVLLLALVFSLVTLFVYRYCYAPYQVLKRYGIKGPRPLPLIGNYAALSKMGMMDFFASYLYKDYQRPLCGFYLGSTPCIMATDPELIKEITVKDFDSFTDRVVFRIIPRPYGPEGLFTAKGDEWKDKRHKLTPAFSASKMKMMVPLVKRSADTLVDKFKEKAESGESIEVMRAYGAFTLESILAAAFGRVIDVQRGEADEVTRAAKAVFDGGRGKLLLVALFFASTVPFLSPLLDYYLTNFTNIVEPWKVIRHTALKLIEARRSGTAKPAKYKDMLQLMIDASDDAPGSGNERASTTAQSGCPMHQNSNGSTEHRLSAKEIVDNSVTFLIAGYETTANALSFTTYLLALNPTIQEKLQSEIDAYFRHKPDATLYEASQEITYLDNVIQETLRIYPPAPFTNRTCTKTTTLSDGTTIPKGTQICGVVD